MLRIVSANFAQHVWHSRSQSPLVRVKRPLLLFGLSALAGQRYIGCVVKNYQSAYAKSKGFSLIEVLISMLILAFGVLSMGGLQIASLKSAQASSNFSAAATLAKDYTEMMRSNSSISSITSTAAGANPYLFDTANTTTFVATPPTDCKTTVCSAAQISVLHVADWAERVKTSGYAQLPGARAVVCRDPAPRLSNGTYRWGCGTNDGSAVTIKIGWIDKRDKEERGTTTVSATPFVPQLVLGGLTGYAE